MCGNSLSFAKIHLFFFHKPNRQLLEWGCGQIYHSRIFQVFNGGTDVCTPYGMKYCFLFIVFQGRGSSNVFHTPFLSNSPHPTGNGTNVGGDSAKCCLFNPIISFGIEVITGVVGDPLSPLWSRPELKLHWSPDHHNPLWWLVSHSDIVGLLELVPVESQGLEVLEMSISFPMVHSYFCKRTESLWGRSTSWLMSKNELTGPRLSLFIIQVRLLIT